MQVSGQILQKRRKGEGNTNWVDGRKKEDEGFGGVETRRKARYDVLGLQLIESPN